MAGSSGDYQRTLTAVVNFLEDAGFHAARNTLLETIAGVHQEEESPAAFAAHGSPGGDSAAEDAQTLLASLPPRAVTSLEHGEAAGESRLANLATENSNSLRAKPKFAGVKVPWDEAINEYETLEDVGYQRKDISSQQAFLENEVETELDRDTGANAGSTPHAHSNAANTSGSEFAGDSDSTCGSSISGAVIDLMPVPSCHMSAPPASPQGGAPMFGRSALDLPFPSTGDTAWDLGPIGIRIAEPVTTPTKSSGAAASDEPRPVLSRVESLSSSFKDFDIECNADDWPSRRVSSAQDGGLQSYDCGADDEVIDFQPTLHSGGASQEGELDLMPSAASQPQLNLTPPQLDLSPTQLDLAPPQLDLSPPHLDLTPPQLDLSPPQLDLSPPQLDLAPLQLDLAPPQLDLAPAQLDLAPPPTTLSDLETPLPLESPTPSQEPVSQSDDKEMKPAPRPENIGGFSFPVAATPSETQPDHRLFKSWPSVRSSCTSEVIAASDDDHVAADYADDEYLRSVSKPTSRSTSQNLSEIAKACLRSEEDLIASQQSGLEGWSFAQPKASVSASGRKQDSPTEPHLVLSPTSPAKPNPTAPTASCISEPSTTTSYNTCLPPGFGMHGHAATASPQSATGPSHTSTSVSPAAAQQGPGETEGQGSFHGPGPERTPFSATSGKGRPGVTAATGRLAPPATQYPGTSGSASPSAASAAVSPGLLQEFDPSDQQSEDMTTADEDHDDLDSNVDDDEGQETGDGEMDLAVEAAASLQWQQLQIHPASGGGTPPSSPGPEHVSPRYTVNDDGSVTFEYDPEYISRKYEILDLRVYHRRHRTGFEETKDFPIRMHDLIAGRYQVVDFLGSAAFSRAVQALDIKTGVLVCLKIIKNNKDYLDQSLDEIKLLKYVNTHDPDDKFGVVRLYDYFYYKEHLFLVCELLRANLYEFQKYNRESGDAPYFTNARIQRIALQVLRSLCFIHALGLIHSDLKPENILIKSYSKCEVKVIDLGSSCFITDQLSSYVQSRSYRAPEVILGLKYDQKVDIWSLGCILAELSSGSVLFQNDSLATLLARLEGILGPVPPWMIHKGRYANRFYTRSNLLYEKNATTERYELLTPKRTSLRHRVPDADDELLDFIASLLQVDPNLRPTAEDALQHPWLKKQYIES